MLKENRSEKPGTFYIEEIWRNESDRGLIKIVITRRDGTQHVDYPVLHFDGSFGYDFPERVPAQVKQAMKDRFTTRGEKVIFRVWRDTGAVIALFPRLSDGVAGYTCQSYEHVGQHGGADPQTVISRTRLAKPAEYRELARELRGLGYKLRIMSRCTYADLLIRKARL